MLSFSVGIVDGTGCNCYYPGPPEFCGVRGNLPIRGAKDFYVAVGTAKHLFSDMALQFDDNSKKISSAMHDSISM